METGPPSDVVFLCPDSEQWRSLLWLMPPPLSITLVLHTTVAPLIPFLKSLICNSHFKCRSAEPLKEVSTSIYGELWEWK